MIIKETPSNVDQKNQIRLVINNQQVVENVSIELKDNNLNIKGHYLINLKFIKETKFSSSVLSLWVRPFNKLQFSGNCSLLSQIYNSLSQRSLNRIKPESIDNEYNFALIEGEIDHLCKNERFKKTNLNFDYEVCNSLSRYWIVPKTINDTLLKHAARFRARNRLPTLSYVHNDKIVLIRSSQPLCGLGYKRSVQDEKLVREFTIGTDLVIIDARSAASAFANAMTGKGGSELESHYNAKKRIFLNLDNVHYVRRAEQEIFENNNSIDWISLLNKLLVAAFVIAEEMIIGGNSVLLHCSDGWDRTAQLVSLVQILLDRRYRTKKGLATLIEKEWLGAGHQFSKRMGIQSDPHEIEEQGNVFGQFINILWIFWKSQPTCFEWNESILEEIWKEACDPDGYFNGDNERIRVIRENIWNILEHSGKLSSLDIDKLKRVEMLPFYPSMRLFQP